MLRAVIDTGSVPRAADLLNISSTTARSHLTGISTRPGVRTQAGLIRILIEGTLPFRS